MCSELDEVLQSQTIRVKEQAPSRDSARNEAKEISKDLQTFADAEIVREDYSSVNQGKKVIDFKITMVRAFKPRLSRQIATPAPATQPKKLTADSKMKLEENKKNLSNHLKTLLVDD